VSWRLTPLLGQEDGGHFGGKLGMKHASAVVNHILPKGRLLRLHFCRRRYGSNLLQYQVGYFQLCSFHLDLVILCTASY